MDRAPMKIELQSPYKELYNHGYLRQRKDGRRVVDLFNSNKDRTTTAYARYLLGVKHNRILEDWEEADHRDDDFTNDCIDNLQILESVAHRRKSAQNRGGRTIVSLICPVCGITFEREKRQVKVAYPKCSRHCNGVASTTM
jgi:hypothetical protein